MLFYEGRDLSFNAFRSAIFPIKATKDEGRPRMLASRPLEFTKRLKTLTPNASKITNSSCTNKSSQYI